MTDKTHVLRGDKLVLKNTYITKDITISHNCSNCSLIFDGDVIFKKGDKTILTLKG